MVFVDALRLLKEGKRAKFDETVEVAMNMDSKSNEVAIRGSIEAPHKIGRPVKIALFADIKPEGVEYAGGEDLIDRFLKGDIKKCDVCIASRKYMPMISSKIGKILGRKRIMPDARFGTVTEDNEQEIMRAINSFLNGRMNFRANKNVIHTVLGKISAQEHEIEENFQVLVREVKALLPPKTRIDTVHLSSTMSRGSISIKVGNI
jgi:large subunit ribosomal protein L1